MSSIRKPVNDPFGRGNKKLPPLPAPTSSGTMSPTQGTPPVTPVIPAPTANPPVTGLSGSPQGSQSSSPVLPVLPRPGQTSSLPPLPGLTPKPVTEEPLIDHSESTFFSSPMVEEENPYAIDPKYLDEDYVDDEEELISEEDEVLIQRISYATDYEIKEPTIHALLSNDEIEPEVVEAIASNPATPHEFLEALAENEDEFIRQAVMENPAIDDELYASFINDEEIMIVAALVENPRTGRDILLALREHEDPYIHFLLKQSTLLTDAEKTKL